MPLNKRGSVSDRLEGMVLIPQHGLELIERRFERLEPTWVLCPQSVFSTQNVQRSPPLTSGLREHQAPIRKIESRQRQLAPELGATSLPLQSPGYHQVQYHPELVIKPERDPLAHPANLPHFLPRHRVDRGIERAQEKRRLNTHPLERLAGDSPLERFNVHSDVRQLGHGFAMETNEFAWGTSSNLPYTPGAIHRSVQKLEGNKVCSSL